MKKEMVIRDCDLIGFGFLSGVDYSDESITFILNNVKYNVEIDKDDGYRSYCKDINILPENTKIINTFEPQEVFIIYSRICDGIDIIDKYTGKVILNMGTDYSDDWYPLCIFVYNPENMFCNKDKE